MVALTAVTLVCKSPRVSTRALIWPAASWASCALMGMPDIAMFRTIASTPAFTMKFMLPSYFSGDGSLVFKFVLKNPFAVGVVVFPTSLQHVFTRVRDETIHSFLHVADVLPHGIGAFREGILDDVAVRLTDDGE